MQVVIWGVRGMQILWDQIGSVWLSQPVWGYTAPSCRSWGCEGRTGPPGGHGYLWRASWISSPGSDPAPADTGSGPQRRRAVTATGVGKVIVVDVQFFCFFIYPDKVAINPVVQINSVLMGLHTGFMSRQNLLNYIFGRWLRCVSVPQSFFISIR